LTPFSYNGPSFVKKIFSILYFCKWKTINCVGSVCTGSIINHPLRKFYNWSKNQCMLRDCSIHMQIFISRMLLSYFLKKNTLFFKNTKLDECLPGILIESNKKNPIKVCLKLLSIISFVKELIRFFINTLIGTIGVWPFPSMTYFQSFTFQQIYKQFWYDSVNQLAFIVNRKRELKIQNEKCLCK